MQKGPDSRTKKSQPSRVCSLPDRSRKAEVVLVRVLGTVAENEGRECFFFRVHSTAVQIVLSFFSQVPFLSACFLT